MKTKLLFLCLFSLVLILPAELKKDDHHKNEGRQKDKKQGAPGKKHQSRHKDIVEDPYFRLTEDPNDNDEPNTEWILNLQDLDGKCSPNPCINNGVCEERGRRGFKCVCPEPFKGMKCQRGPKVCKRGTCGRGECVLTSVAPFYACKCKEPFQPPNCQSVAPCKTNPCQNGGTCVKDDDDFDCTCPTGFSGRFCHVGPNDCYSGNGESYRGMVSETDDGDECLHWNSHFILNRGTNPFSAYENDEGLGPHNFCRNPDGDTMPWCFIRRGRRLLWNHCSVRNCTAPSVVPGPEPTKIPVETRPVPATTPSLPATGRQFSSCGRPQPKRAISRIYGGLKALPGAQPWQLSLQVRPERSSLAYRHICGAVLIDSCWALTAGHCIDKKNSMQVVAGGFNLDLPELTEQTITVEKAMLHENYRETKSAVYNDIALLKLKATDGECATESQFVKAACLPTSPLPDGKECTISGWGSTEESDHGTNHLLDAEVLLISQEKCSDVAVYGKNLNDGMFCAGYLQGGVDSCQGDSGGPLTCDTNGTHVIYGLVSWGDSCGKQNKPGVYTRITHFLSWIHSKMQAS